MRVLAVLCLALLSAPVRAEVLTNDAVMALSRAGLTPEMIVAKIHASEPHFATDSDSLIALKQARVADAVIAAMLARPSAAATGGARLADDPPRATAAGVYLVAAGGATPRLQRIEAIVTSETRNSNVLGYAFTGGMSHITLKSVVPGTAAAVRTTDPQPVFQFNLGKRLPGGSVRGLARQRASALSPDDLILVRLEIKGGLRLAPVGTFRMSNMRTGAAAAGSLAFSFEEVSPGVFRVAPDGDLPPGEYGFVDASVSGGGGAGVYSKGVVTATVIDFGIDPPVEVPPL